MCLLVALTQATCGAHAENGPPRGWKRPRRACDALEARAESEGDGLGERLADGFATGTPQLLLSAASNGGGANIRCRRRGRASPGIPEIFERHALLGDAEGPELHGMNA